MANGLAPGVGGLRGLREISGGTRIIFFGPPPRRPAAVVAPSGLSELRSPQQRPAAALGTKAKFFSGRIPAFRAGVGAARGNPQSAKAGFLSASGGPAGAQAPTGLRLLR